MCIQLAVKTCIASYSVVCTECETCTKLISLFTEEAGKLIARTEARPMSTSPAVGHMNFHSRFMICICSTKLSISYCHWVRIINLNFHFTCTSDASKIPPLYTGKHWSLRIQKSLSELFSFSRCPSIPLGFWGRSLGRILALCSPSW